MRGVHEAPGLRVECIKHDMDDAARKDAMPPTSPMPE